MRLIRAIEIAKHLGKVPKITPSLASDGVYEFVKIGLCLPVEKLKKKIEKRLAKRLKTGMLNEARKLHKEGLSWQRMAELGLEYRCMALYLQKKITKEEMIENLKMEIFKYAKRQMTWFKRDEEIKWFDASKKINFEKISQAMKIFFMFTNSLMP